MTEPDVAKGIRLLLDTYDAAQRFPFGPPLEPQHRQTVGEACVRLCDGDPDKGRSLWKLIVDQCGGYMPAAAGIALIRATPVATMNLVPDVTAPEPT